MFPEDNNRGDGLICEPVDYWLENRFIEPDGRCTADGSMAIGASADRPRSSHDAFASAKRSRLEISRTGSQTPAQKFVKLAINPSDFFVMSVTGLNKSSPARQNGLMRIEITAVLMLFIALTLIVLVEVSAGEAITDSDAIQQYPAPEFRSSAVKH